MALKVWTQSRSKNLVSKIRSSLYLILRRHVPDPENPLSDSENMTACWCNFMQIYLVLTSNTDHSTGPFKYETFINREFPNHQWRLRLASKITGLWIKWPATFYRTLIGSHNCLFWYILTNTIRHLDAKININGIHSIRNISKRAPPGLYPLLSEIRNYHTCLSDIHQTQRFIPNITERSAQLK